MSHKNPWKTHEETVVYENPWLRVREDRVTRPDGGDGIYSVVEIRPSVGVVAINEANEVALVGQWRYVNQRYSWEIPRGGSHAGDSDVLEAARRELREEAGIEAAEWQFLTAVDVCNGVTNDVQHLYLAKGLKRVATNQDPEEQIVTRFVPFAEAVEMAMHGEITEVCSIAALLIVRQRVSVESAR